MRPTTWATVVIYRFWAQVRAARFHHPHLSFAEGRFDHHGTGREEFIGFLKGHRLLLPFSAALYFERTVLAKTYGPIVAQIGTIVTFFVIMFPWCPLILVTFSLYSSIHFVKVRNFRMEYATIGDLRFDFRGPGRELFWLSMLGMPVCHATLGLAVPG